jgi:hypothetical protein
MKIIDNVAAFGCGVVTTVIAATLYVDLGAQPVVRNVVDVCANVEGTLRLTDPGVPCQGGERLLRLRQPNVDEKKEEEQAQEDGRLKGLQDRVKELEERAAKGRLMASRVIAPFEVINDEGYAVLKVEDGYVWFNNAQGKTVARVVMNEFGGYFQAISATANLQAVLGAIDNKVNLFLQENEKPRINLGRNDSGQYGLRVYEAGGKMVAGIGQATAGDGVVTVNDTQGNQRAAIYVQPKAGGIVEVLNNAGKGVASMFATEAGNGQMLLTNAGGAKMVEAGVNTENIGVVRAGPASFAPGVGILGLPGSYIAGKAAK